VNTTVTYAHFFLAMTHQRLGHRDEAAQWLKTAIQAIDADSTTRPTSAGRLWKRELALHLLRNESEKLIAP
jgi:hypothetical protein